MMICGMIVLSQAHLISMLEVLSRKVLFGVPRKEWVHGIDDGLDSDCNFVLLPWILRIEAKNCDWMGDFKDGLLRQWVINAEIHSLRYHLETSLGNLN